MLLNAEVYVLACYIVLPKNVQYQCSFIIQQYQQKLVFLECSLLYSTPEKRLILVFLTNVLGIFAGVDSQTICPARIFFLDCEIVLQRVLYLFVHLFYFILAGVDSESALQRVHLLHQVCVFVCVCVCFCVCVCGPQDMCICVVVCVCLCGCAWVYVCVCDLRMCVYIGSRRRYMYILYPCMYNIYIYICMYTHTHTHTNTHTHQHTHTYTHTHTHTHTHMGVDNGLLQIYVQIYIRIYVYTCMNTYTHTVVSHGSA